VRVLTAAGKEAFGREGVAANGNTISLDASGLAAGMYIVELKDATGNTQLQKFVKE
jgi:hypothetical protein